MVMPTGQRARDRLAGPAGLDEGHHLALVVAGAAGADDLAPVRQRRHPRLERRRLPQLERIDRLHVVVTVEQHVRRAVGLRRVGEHDRMAGRVAHLGLETHGLEIAFQPFGGRGGRSLA